uniref:Uncharacterized protein n=1 Tax=viral metagenome TaxID=1070528 RepID=A0A6C0ADJ2_9ZZZZ
MEYPDTILDYIKNNKDKIFEYFYPYYDELEIKVLFSSFSDFKEYVTLKIKFLIMKLFIFLNSKNKNEEKYYTYKQDDRSNIGIKYKLNKKYYKIILLLFKCVLNKDFSVFNFSKTENKNLYSYNDVNLWIEFLEKTTTPFQINR